MPSWAEPNFIAGHPAGLRFELALCARSEERADAATYGRLLVWLAEDLIWGQYDSKGTAVGVEWYWVELLEHLATNWRYLRYEQGYPFRVMPVRPSGLMLSLEQRWTLPEIDEAAEDDVVYGFQSSHNFAMALDGCVVPDLWFVREGRTVLIEGRDHVRRCSHERELNTLEQLGTFLYKRLSQLSDSRSLEAKSAWEQRDAISFEEKAAITTHESLDALRTLADGAPLAELLYDPLTTSIEDNRAIDLVYRCKGLLPVECLRQLLQELRNHTEPPRPALEDLTCRIQDEKASLEDRGFPPHTQGRRLALKLRHDPDLFSAPDARAEPEHLLKALGVEVEKRSFDSRRLDAVGLWGRNVNPYVLVNLHDKHLNNVGALRATIAHELCHILVDRKDVLPLSAVVRGVMDRAAEQRANAFAAELLCPRFYVRNLYEQFLSAADVVAVATSKLGVSNELAALQLARAYCQLGPDDEQYIESLVAPDASLPWR